MVIKHTFIKGLFWIFLCGVITFDAAANAAAQSATFTTRAYSLLGNNHVAADFNGDGKLDLAGSGANSAGVMLGNGDGTFGAKVDYPVVSWAQDIAAGDFNSDGRTDLVVTINTTQNSLSLLTGNGDGTFNAPVNFPNTSGFDSPSVVAVDLNNDARLDVVIAHEIACYTAPCVPARTISVMMGNGDGTFQPTREIEVGTGMSRIVVGDINRDGVKDLGIAGDRAQIYILTGIGNGTFVQQTIVAALPGETTSFMDATDIDAADLNGDAVLDLVVAIALNENRTVILIGNGDGTFRAPSFIVEPSVRVPDYQAIADYNGDGKQDLALALGWGLQGLMEILNGNGDGTFQQPVLYLVPPPKSSVSGGVLIAGDFNGDGKSDIALQVTGASPGLDVLINSSGAITPPPATVTVSALAINPSAVTGGNAATGTITLSARVQTATIVRLASSSASATAPASVTVAAGASSANFTVNTTQVSAATSATITATLNGVTRSASVTVNPTAAPTTDTVGISKADYDSRNRTLRVEASSNRTNATLQVFVTSSGQLVGTLSNNGGGKYSGQFNVSANPQNITVRSSAGGQATRAVTAK